MSNQREASGIVVNVLDLQPAMDNASKQLEKSLKAKGYEAIHVMGTHGFVVTKKGTFALEAEGVIARKPLSDANKHSIDLYPCSFGEVDGKRIMTKQAMIPIAVMHVGLDDLKEIPVKEQVPLESFVRSFGRRLEANYAICLQHLRKMNK